MGERNGPVGSTRGLRRRLTDLFIVGFLGIQLVVPLRGIIWDKHATRADFSWNMYSKRYSCRIDYDVVSDTGKRTRLQHRDFFYPRRSKAMKVFHRDTLPWFHHYLCDRARESRFGQSIRGDVSCAINNGEYVQLVDPSVDICTAPDFGIIEP